MLLIDKSKMDVMGIALQRLSENTNINGTSPGDVAERFLNAIAEIFTDEEEGFYPLLKIKHLSAFLSTATGDAVDMIGYLLSCRRREGETDDSYKDRISKQPLSLANANETAVRLAVLSVQGIKDVVLKPFTHGTGSFSAYIVTDNPYGEDDLIQAVRSNVDRVKAFGIQTHVFKPKVLPIQLKAKVVFDKNISDSEKPALLSQVQEKVKNYINGLYPGEQIVIGELVRTAMEVDKRIYNLNFLEMRINNRLALVNNQKSKWNERFFEAQVPNAIQVM